MNNKATDKSLLFGDLIRANDSDFSSKITKLILIRHGQSLGNAENVYLGHTDLDLSPLGYQQAELAARAIKSEPVSAIYSSSLIRAHNTALPHARLHGLSVIDSDELREIYLGEWEMCKLSDLETVWYDEFVLGWRKNFGTYCPPGGESVPHLALRIHKELIRIAEENTGGYVVIASHAAAIRSVWGRVAKIDPEKLADAVPFPTNASLTTMYYDGKELHPIRYSIRPEELISDE